MDELFGLLVLGAIVVCVVLLAMSSRRKQEAAAARALEEIRPYQQAYAKALASADPQIIMKTGSGLVEATRYWQPWKIASVTEEVYKDALKLLKEHPEAKPYVLATGRSAYAVKRPEGKPTIYDEQAIMNDISAHS